jgi:hypothetical protein
LKKSILFLCLICLSHYCISQTFGLRGGINVAQQAWKVNDEKMTSASMIGALGAFSINLEQGEKTSGQLELSYSEMGFGETNIGDSIRVLEGKYKYLKFGCAFKYHVKRSTNLHAGVELGFQFEEFKDLRYLFNPDFGFFIGAEQYIGPYIGIGMRYYLGLADISNVNEVDLTLKQFNRAFQVYIAFRFPGKQLKEMGY